MTRFLIFALALLVLRVPLEAGKPAKADTPGASDRNVAASRGYVDLDRDGVNDRFRDANGDGVDDVTGKAYPHRFRFVDRDRDGVNDLFVDRDGDGVNDLDARYVDRDGDGVCDNVVDYDGDSINDISGLKYDRFSLKGFRYGLVDEERGIVHRRFLDTDGDGMNDLRQYGLWGRGRGGGMDYFVDEDGDGICDGRTIRGRRSLGPAWSARGRRAGQGVNRRVRGNIQNETDRTGGGR